MKGHTLRSCDAVHLASALWLRDTIDSRLRFVCADLALVAAASAEQLETLVPGAPT